MDTKLTLKLDKDIIDRAKEYAATHQRSLSKIIESYLQTIVKKDDIEDSNDIEISPFVKSMSSKINLPIDFDYKKDRLEYLLNKHA